MYIFARFYQAFGFCIDMNFEKDKIEEFGRLLSGSDNIVLVGHFNPDGDAVGSTTGLWHYLKAIGKNATIVYPNEFPLSMSPFLKDVDYLIVSCAEKAVRAALERAELLICLDFCTYSRTCEQIESRLQQMSCPKVVIDHHENPDNIGLLFSDTKASSTCELVYKILSSLDENNITIDCASALYAGICTDTGSFSHSCSRRDVFDVVGDLTARGRYCCGKASGY